MKIENDKYYTPPDVARLVYNTTKDILKIDNSVFIEPSAGAGVFLDVLEKNNEKYLAYDLFPEDSRIIKADFLTTNIKYSDNNIVIGNPPFGGRGGFVIRRFINKSKECSNYISFILPISYLNKYNPLYSKDLGKINFSGVELHVCHSIYDLRNMPKSSILKNPSNTLFSVFDVRQKSKTKEHLLFDSSNYTLIRFCTFGSAAGKVIEESSKFYAKELWLYINKNYTNNEELISHLVNSLGLMKHISTPNISKTEFIRILDEINIQKN